MPTIPRNQSHLAELLGLARSAVSAQVKRGMPVDSVEAAKAWRDANIDPARRKSQKFDRHYQAGPPASNPPATARQPSEDDLGEDFKAARTRREISEANLSEMRESEERRDLIRVAAVKSALATAFAATRDGLLQIPARLAPMLAADTDPASVQNLLHQEIHRALMHLSGAAERVGQTDEPAHAKL